MRSKKDLVDLMYKKHGLSKAKLITMVGMAASSYYRKPSKRRKGKRASIFTFHKTKGFVSQGEIVKAIKKVLTHPFINCGYRLMASYLKRDGYKINHKKLYRIMKENNLLKLKDRINRSGAGRKFVKHRKVTTQRPFECLEMDIKMIWIPEVGKNAFLLSVIDVHTRRIMTDYFAYSIKKDQVIILLSELLLKHQYPENVVIRSDNGSQFIAKDVRSYLKLIGVDQEFTHIATPEENAHIEAYHGILKKEVFQRFEYRTFKEIEEILIDYVDFYNNLRLHGLLGRITPMEKWNADKKLILTNKLIA